MTHGPACLSQTQGLKPEGGKPYDARVVVALSASPHERHPESRKGGDRRLGEQLLFFTHAAGNMCPEIQAPQCGNQLCFHHKPGKSAEPMMRPVARLALWPAA